MNFAQLEPALVDHIKTLAVAQRVRAVEPLPETDIETLVRRFGQDAPAIYVTAGGIRVRDEHVMTYTASLMPVARNASGYAGPRAHDARHGEGKGAAGLIGLYEILGFLIPELHLADIGDVEWRVTGGGGLIDFPQLWKEGLYATTLQLESGPVEIDSPLDEAALEDFITFAADWDLGPEPDGQLEAEDNVQLPQE